MPKHLFKLYCVKDNNSEREGDNRGFVMIMLAIVVAMMRMVTRVVGLRNDDIVHRKHIEQRKHRRLLRCKGKKIYIFYLPFPIS